MLFQKCLIVCNCIKCACLNLVALVMRVKHNVKDFWLLKKTYLVERYSMLSLNLRCTSLRSKYYSTQHAHIVYRGLQNYCNSRIHAKLSNLYHRLWIWIVFRLFCIYWNNTLGDLNSNC